MSPLVETPYPTNEFKDRQAGLVVFGILTALIGGMCALFVSLMFLGQTMAAKTGAPQDTHALVPAILIYGGLAVALVWLGIGSMMSKRWARALLLIFSWSALITGVLGLGMMAFMLPHFAEAIKAAPRAGRPELPPSAVSAIVAMMMIIMGVILIILPAVWILFYKSKHVKATCEAHDPVVRWTDRCPLPVIGICLWLSFWAAMMLTMAMAYRGVAPLFGMFLVGPLGFALNTLIALLWGYSAWALYGLHRQGWWIAVISICALAVSAFITYSRHDVSEVYSLMGYSQERIVQIQKFGFVNGGSMAWITLICWVPLLGYLLYVRKFFPPVLSK